MAVKFITAGELAEELMKNPQDIVVITSKNPELKGAAIPMGEGTEVELNRFKGKLENCKFQDMFSGDHYYKDVVVLSEESEEIFVHL